MGSLLCVLCAVCNWNRILGRNVYASQPHAMCINVIMYLAFAFLLLLFHRGDRAYRRRQIDCGVRLWHGLRSCVRDGSYISYSRYAHTRWVLGIGFAEAPKYLPLHVEIISSYPLPILSRSIAHITLSRCFNTCSGYIAIAPSPSPQTIMNNNNFLCILSECRSFVDKLRRNGETDRFAVASARANVAKLSWFEIIESVAYRLRPVRGVSVWPVAGRCVFHISHSKHENDGMKR